MWMYKEEKSVRSFKNSWLEADINMVSSINLIKKYTS